jgi:glucokinase
VLDEAGSAIGYAVSILINLFSPDVVVLGGPVGTAAGDLLLRPVRREAQLRSVSGSFRHTQIVTGALGTQAATIGAANLALSQTSAARVVQGGAQDA